MSNILGLKNLGFGAGFRKTHRDRFLSGPTKLSWIEVISENYMGMSGQDPSPALQTLEILRKDYPVAMHGVSLSLGSTDPLDMNYLKRIKTLIERIQPSIVSDHLCWTGVDGQNLHDLLPLPYREDVIDHVVERIVRVQDFLGRQILVENVSSYLTYSHSEMPEWEFLSEITEAADCGILLDVNNIYVSGHNHRFDPLIYLKKMPVHRVGQIHLAGHSDEGTHLLDTHDHPVPDPVWNLYKETLKLVGPVSTMVEWDDQIPPFDVLEAEVMKAKDLFERKTHDQKFDHTISP